HRCRDGGLRIHASPTLQDHFFTFHAASFFPSRTKSTPSESALIARTGLSSAWKRPFSKYSFMFGSRSTISPVSTIPIGNPSTRINDSQPNCSFDHSTFPVFHSPQRRAVPYSCRPWMPNRCSLNRRLVL